MSRPSSAFRSKALPPLEHLDAIFDVKGIDLVFVGPVDLSISLGLDPLPENPDPTFQRALVQDYWFCPPSPPAARDILLQR